MSQKLREPKPRAKRRGNNAGSIHQRSDGRWCGQVVIGYKTDGKPMRKTVYGHSKLEVTKQVVALTHGVFEGGYTTISARHDTNFEILCKEWFDTFVAPNLASVTEEGRRSMLRKHIFADLGAFDIKDIDSKRLQRFFNAKSKADVKGRMGYSADAIGKMKYLLNNFFAYAHKQRYIAENPMSDVVIRKNTGNKSEKSGRALRPEIREDVINLAIACPVLKPIMVTFMLTGIRPQELIALRWTNVNIEGKTIFIKEALNRVSKFDEDGNVVSRGTTVGKTKTPKSVRQLVMPDSVVDAIVEWKRYCGENAISSDYVFPNTKTGEMRTYSGLCSLLRRFIKRHNLQGENISLYTFRHTFATVLLEQRENPKIVSKMMGHSKVSTTLDLYSEVFDPAYEQTAKTLDSVYIGFTAGKVLQ